MTAMQSKYISAEEVTKKLTWPLVNYAVEEALKAIGRTEIDPKNPQHSYAIQPARTVATSGDRTKLLLCMPGYVGNYKTNETAANTRNTLACKLVTSFSNNQNHEPPLPNILANILLFNEQTGELQCVMDGTQITAWRTASASIIATKHLYFKRFKDGVAKPIRLAIIGCGVQGESHALGMCKTFDVVDVYLWNRTKSKAEKLSAKLQSDFPNTIVYIAESAKQAVENADVICVATYSPNALINCAMLKGGDVHINAVGAGQVHFGEVAQDIYDKGVVYVDSSISAKVELKDLKARIIGEVGEVIRNGKRTEKEKITIYQSMGVAAEDATVAQAVYDALKLDKN